MKIVVYCLHNPWPPRTGLHQRVVQILRGLTKEGHKVTFASSILHSEHAWTPKSEDALRQITGQPVHVYDSRGCVEEIFDRVERKIRGWVGRGRGSLEPFEVPYSLIRWFRNLVIECDADAILMNYVWFDRLMDHRRWRRRHRLIDTIDIQSINRAMWHFADSQVNRSGAAHAAAFRSEFNTARETFEVDPEEIGVYRKYSKVICISETERAILSASCPPEQLVYFPYVQAPVDVRNTYDGPPFVSLGPNPFNRQGYLYFVAAILPLIIRVKPEFRLIVTGSMLPPADVPQELEWRGFVADRRLIMKAASYSISPVFAGTGQQIKIIEAMAHGLAVVVFEEAAKGSFVRHDENALVAASSEEFARHVVRLEQNPELRVRLGETARGTIAREYEKYRAFPAVLPHVGTENH